mmetsp:Transcript_15564/g.49662  ORF Transcript_15564/g.49662 Transcript_15564/m.49662 type:complete len:224 (+) Transcript_15564:352-1023(+)
MGKPEAAWARWNQQGAMPPLRLLVPEQFNLFSPKRVEVKERGATRLSILRAEDKQAPIPTITHWAGEGLLQAPRPCDRGQHIQLWCPCRDISLGHIKIELGRNRAQGSIGAYPNPNLCVVLEMQAEQLATRLERCKFDALPKVKSVVGHVKVHNARALNRKNKAVPAAAAPLFRIAPRANFIARQIQTLQLCIESETHAHGIHSFPAEGVSAEPQVVDIRVFC